MPCPCIKWLEELQFYSGMDFLRVTWLVTHFQSNLAKYTKKRVTLGHHQHAGVKEKLIQLYENKVNWAWVLPQDNLPTLTDDICLEKTVGGAVFRAFNSTSVSVKYCDPSKDLGKVP